VLLQIEDTRGQLHHGPQPLVLVVNHTVRLARIRGAIAADGSVVEERRRPATAISEHACVRTRWFPCRWG
jgi:hypothetical protein